MRLAATELMSARPSGSFTSYFLASTIVTALVGKLGDLFGRK